MSRDNKHAFRNFWPSGTRGGVTKVKPNKKGKGSYNRKNKNKGNCRNYHDNCLYSCIYAS